MNLEKNTKRLSILFGGLILIFLLILAKKGLRHLAIQRLDLQHDSCEKIYEVSRQCPTERCDLLVSACAYDCKVICTAKSKMNFGHGRIEAL